MNPDMEVGVSASKNVLVTVTIEELLGNGIDLDVSVKV